MKTDNPMRDVTKTLAQVILFMLACLAFVAMTARCAGPVKAVEGGVRIDASHCKESTAHADDPDLSLLECASGEATIRVELGRAEWHAIRARTAPAPFEAGPGK